MAKKNISNTMMVFMVGVVCVMTTLLPDFSKKNINYVSKQHISASIKGIGDIKSSKLIYEKDKNGVFKNENDFNKRVKGILGSTTIERVHEVYKVGE